MPPGAAMTAPTFHQAINDLDSQRIADEAVGASLEYLRIVRTIHAMQWRSTEDHAYRERVLEAIEPSTVESLAGATGLRA